MDRKRSVYGRSVTPIHLVTKFSAIYSEGQRKLTLVLFRNKHKGSNPHFWIFFPAFKIHRSKFRLLNKIIPKFTPEYKRVLLDIKKLHSEGS